jgi:hypothetical protein
MVKTDFNALKDQGWVEVIKLKYRYLGNIFCTPKSIITNWDYLSL